MEPEEEQEQEWIESPDGWGGQNNLDDDDNNNNNNNNKVELSRGEGEEEKATATSSSREDVDDGGFFHDDLFANKDPRDFFEFDLVVVHNNKKTTTSDDDDDDSEDASKTKTTTLTTTTKIRLEGYKLDSDETAQSTGVTLWQAAPRLANYLQQQQQQQVPAGLVIKDQKVLELGSGLGLCGIVAYHLGAKCVVMTDGDTQTLQQMRRNVQLNCCGGSNNSNVSSSTATGSSDDDQKKETTERIHQNPSQQPQQQSSLVNSNRTTSTIIDCKQLIWGSPHMMEKFQTKYGVFDVVLGADVIYTKESTGPLFDTVACLLSKPNGRFILSRYNKWNNVSDDIVVQAAKERNLILLLLEEECYCGTSSSSSSPPPPSTTTDSEGIFIFGWKR